MLILGDCHGRFDRLAKISEKYPNRVLTQIGDMGLGFGSKNENIPSNVRFFRGNHDNPQVCKSHSNYIKDWGQWTSPEGESCFVFGGAFSIDRDYRLRREQNGGGVSWWYDEEIFDDEIQKAYEEARGMKSCDILLTHDCSWDYYPLMIETNCTYNPGMRAYGKPIQNRTAIAVQNLISILRPKIHVFGHHHNNMILKIHGRTSVNAGELSLYDTKTEQLLLYGDIFP